MTDKPYRPQLFKDDPPEPVRTGTRGVPPVDTSRYDRVSKAAWQEGKFLICLQDERMTEQEHRAIADLGKRLWGRRFDT